MPIQITITASNAEEANQLVQDLASTMAQMDPADVPEKTEVSTVDQPQAPQQQVSSTVVPTAPMQQTSTVVPTSTPTYTMDQLAVAATQLMDAGKREELVQLLASFGVQALTSLPKEQYGAFATKLRELGAKI